MILTPMRYKSYTWPHNPRVYSIDYERKMAVHKVPFGYYYLQDLGRTRRVMEGEGEFVGEGAYSQFGQLANVFYEEGPGLLIHPVWQAASAYFVSLRLEQEPLPDYVRYSFTFWEDADYYNGAVRVESSAGAAAGTGSGGTGAWHLPAPPAGTPGGPGGHPVGDRPEVRRVPGDPGRPESPDQKPQSDPAGR